MKRDTVEPAKRCDKCNHITEREKYAYFCDQCNKQMSECLSENEIRVSMFLHDDTTRDFYFCSWGCYFRWLLKAKQRMRNKNFYFLNQPYVHDVDVKNFFKAMKKVLK